MKPHRNPFRFGALAKDEDFADREKEVRTLAADAMNGQDVVVFAPRRYGKSSLVSAVMRELVANDILVADIDLWRIPTKEKLAEALAAAIYSDIARLRERAVEKAVAPFRGLRITPTMTVDPDTGGIKFSFTARASQEDIDATLERLLELPAELAADQGKSAVLVIDEFQEIGRIGPGLTNLMRSVFQQQADVAHIYLGSKRHLMEQIFNDQNEPFWKSAKQMELGPIPGPLFGDFIKKRFGDTGKSVDDEVVESTIAITKGHPYATQRLCYEIWQETAPGGGGDMAALDRAFSLVLESEDNHFGLIWEDAATSQRQLLEALAIEPGRPLTRDYRERHQLPATGTVQRAMEALGQKELIGNGGGRAYRIREPFLAEWIRERILPSSVAGGDQPLL
jgi:uncharacterized protein